MRVCGRLEMGSEILTRIDDSTDFEIGNRQSHHAGFIEVRRLFRFNRKHGCEFCENVGLPAAPAARCIAGSLFSFLITPANSEEDLF